MNCPDTYCCESCKFLFVRAGAVEKCPLCESYNVRPATEEEAETLQEQLKKDFEK